MLFFADNKEESVQEILYSIQFVDEEGNIYEVDSSQTKEGCQNYDDINGTLMKHTKNKDGNCIAEYYEGKRCSLCGAVVYGRFIKIQTYSTCPH